MASKSFRVRTQVGKDQNVTFELKQDFDLLEILSLSLTQRDVYTRMCADFGVVCGRVIVNGGFGIPNAKVSVFVPLDGADEDNAVIKQLYPYKEAFDTNDEGIRYNLLSKDPTFDCHTPVGTFPKIEDVLTNQDVEYVYKKYYKFTAKTNDAGDFMIYGVPVGAQTLVMDVDLSDIGCFSMLPEDFKLKGAPESDFNGAKFRDDNNIDSLPQIVNQTKTINVNPFWGDEDECQASITRVDFDLGVSGIRIDPTAVFMGSTATDTSKDYVNKDCKPKKHMGELCSLISQPGIIDCIRYTPFTTFDPDAYGYLTSTGGTVPVLERYYLENGGRVIDASGAWLEHIPMNLDHITTNEFGELVLSYDPEIGVATRARCRFRIRPEQASGSARQARRGSYLVPNLREYNWNTGGNWTGIDYRSYAFSTKYSDYPPHAQQELMPDGKDYFYDMTFNRVYSPSQFHDHVKHAGRRQFTGIKEIMPEMDQQCATSAMFFPVNSAVRRNKFIIFLYMFLLDILRAIYFVIQVVAAVLAMIAGIIFTIVFLIIWILCEIMCALIPIGVGFSVWGYGFSFYPFGFLVPLASSLGCASVTLFTGGCQCDPGGCHYFGFRFGIVLYSLHQQKYPECEKCSCRAGANLDMQQLSNSTCCTLMDPNCGGANPSTPVSPCPVGNAPGSGSAFNLLIWGDDICCPNYESEDEICCPDNYGWDSTADGTGDANCYAGGGCYVKVICINPLCIGRNLNMDVINQYIRREKVTVALCNGIMNYFWENDWVTGFLYQFQFKAKLDFDIGGFTDVKGEVHDTYQGSAYCKKTTYVHPIEHVFYYRSCPTENVNQGSPGSFMGDDDGVFHPWWVVGGGSSGSDHAPGDMNKHILFPTTIVDMGSRNQCIQQICLDERFGTECSVTDQIGSTSFQDITDLVSDIYNIKMDRPNTLLRSFFPRPQKEIGGDVAQALMQNCMVGVYGYETNMGTTECDCPTAPTTTAANNAMLEYPPSHNDICPEGGPLCGTGYVPNAINVMTAGAYDIWWEPLMYTASTQVIMSGADLLNCLHHDLSASTQTVPFYPWYVEGGGFGTYRNDWGGTLGEYRLSFLGFPLNSVTSIFDIWGSAAVAAGDFQDDMAPSFGRPLLNLSSPGAVNFSQPSFYYFGLRPGQTAFNTFVRKYVDEELSNTVL